MLIEKQKDVNKIRQETELFLSPRFRDNWITFRSLNQFSSKVHPVIKTYLAPNLPRLKSKSRTSCIKKQRLQSVQRNSASLDEFRKFDRKQINTVKNCDFTI